MFAPLHSVEQLLADSWHVYKLKFKQLLLINLISIPVVIGIAACVIIAVASVWNDGASALVFIIGAGIGIFFLMIIAAWVSASSMSVAYADVPTVGKALRQGFVILPKYIGLMILQVLIFTGGFILFFVPGVLFYGWFAFALGRLVRGDGVIDSLKHSRALVVGRWWASSLRLLVGVLLVSAVQFAFQMSVNMLQFIGAESQLVIILIVILSGIFWIFMTLFAGPWLIVFMRVLLDNLEETARG